MIFDRRKEERRHGERRQGTRATADRRQAERRCLLKLGVVATVSTLLAHPLLAKASQIILPNREISLYNTHTGENMALECCPDGTYSPEALQEVNHILRDFRTGEIKAIDPRLLSLLRTITTQISPGGQIHIISGYRSPATNLSLTQQSNDVAKRSLHMDGKAIDFRIPGCDLTTLHQVALGLHAGGVGYYAKSNFIHIDTGPVRFW